MGNNAKFLVSVVKTRYDKKFGYTGDSFLTCVYFNNTINKVSHDNSLFYPGFYHMVCAIPQQHFRK